jgi:hypothetical protein
MKIPFINGFDFSDGKRERIAREIRQIRHVKKGENMSSKPELSKSPLPFKIGAVVELAGKVTKRVRREGECKLVIEPGDVPGFVVFADCPGELENLSKLNIRKGSLVSVRGKFQSFGSKAVCLSDCRLLK